MFGRGIGWRSAVGGGGSASGCGVVAVPRVVVGTATSHSVSDQDRRVAICRQRDTRQVIASLRDLRLGTGSSTDGMTPLVLDGGLSNALEDRGHDLTDPLWTARLL